MLKICDVIQFYSHQRSGGIRRYLHEKTAYFAKKKGIEHIIIITGKQNRVRYFRNSKSYLIPSPLFPKSKGYRFILSYSKIWQIFKSEKPDIVEFCFPFFPLRKRPLSFKTICFYHTHLPAYLKVYLGLNLEKWAMKYIKNLYNKFDCTVVTSQRAKRFLAEGGVKNLIYIPLGVDTSIFSPWVENKDLLIKLGIDPEKIILCYAGRLDKEKGVDLIFEVFKKLPPSKFHLLITGDGLIKPPALKNLTYLGYIKEKKKLAQVYATSDYFVALSHYESFGLSVLEAQACGTPIIAFKEAFSEEVIGKKEYLLSERTPRALFEYLLNLEKKSEQETGELNNFVKECFSWERTFKEMTRLYVSLLES